MGKMYHKSHSKVSNFLKVSQMLKSKHLLTKFHSNGNNRTNFNIVPCPCFIWLYFLNYFAQSPRYDLKKYYVKDSFTLVLNTKFSHYFCKKLRLVKA